MDSRTSLDGLMFYSLGAISMLESAASVHAHRVENMFAKDQRCRDWLRNARFPERAKHGAQIRTIVRKIWPAFDWDCAYALFLYHYPACRDLSPQQSSPALEALAQCLVDAGMTTIYRCLAQYTDNVELSELLRSLSADTWGHYRYFNAVFKRHERIEPRGLWCKASVLLQTSRFIPNEEWSRAFDALNAAWKDEPPIVPLTFNEFITRALPVLRRYCSTDETLRMFFAPLRRGRWYEGLVFNALAALIRHHYGMSASPNNRSRSPGSIGNQN